MPPSCHGLSRPSYASFAGGFALHRSAGAAEVFPDGFSSTASSSPSSLLLRPAWARVLLPAFPSTLAVAGAATDAAAVSLYPARVTRGVVFLPSPPPFVFCAAVVASFVVLIDDRCAMRCEFGPVVWLGLARMYSTDLLLAG